MWGAPSSPSITDAIPMCSNPCSQHCLSYMNLGSCHPAEMPTALDVKLDSFLFPSMSTSMYASYTCCVCPPILSALLTSSFSASHQRCSQNFGLQAKPFDPHRPVFSSPSKIQLHLRSIGLQTPPFHPKRLRFRLPSFYCELPHFFACFVQLIFHLGDLVFPDHYDQEDSFPDFIRRLRSPTCASFSKINFPFPSAEALHSGASPPPDNESRLHTAIPGNTPPLCAELCWP